MVHQFLFERGEDPAHAGGPWRREIMRLTKIITGKTVWASRSTTVRRDKHVVRINAPHPETEEPSLPQMTIARWPHDGLGINFGSLGNGNGGAVTHSNVLQVRAAVASAGPAEPGPRELEPQPSHGTG